MKQKIGDRACFNTYDGRIIRGKIVNVLNGHYVVAAEDGSICGSYQDGLYRFPESSVMREDHDKKIHDR